MQNVASRTVFLHGRDQKGPWAWPMMQFNLKGGASSISHMLGPGKNVGDKGGQPEAV